METHFFEWGRLVMMGLQLLVGSVGMIAIFVGLVRMKEAGARRDTEIDKLGAALERQGAALERQGAAMTQALTQQGQVLGQIGQALERQSAAMTQAFTQQGQALTQQGQVLAELLRRSA